MQSYSAEHIILQKLTGNTSLRETDIARLQEIVNNYPYFGAAYFLLAKKMQQDNEGHAEQSIQKTALHFQNPLWLYYNLAEFSEKDVSVSRTALYKEIREQNIQLRETVPADMNNDTSLSEADMAAAEQNAEPMQEEIKTVLEEILQPLIDESRSDEIKSETIIPEPGEINAADTHSEVLHEFDNPADINTEISITPQEDAVMQKEEEEAVAEKTKSETAADQVTDDFTNAAESDAEMEMQDNIAVTHEPQTEENKLSGILEHQLQEFNKPVDVETEVPVASDPYYRVDYFASQGIKLKQEDNPDDELGTRLRSFTGWLKQMKRINAQQPADLGTTQADELAVQVQAAHSNESADIYTEAMADVLVKQGKPERAITVYEKLSFLDPAKSFYFAAKIFELKSKLK